MSAVSAALAVEVTAVVEAPAIGSIPPVFAGVPSS